ncbi:MAG: ABC transporter ATP-binding protein [Candidatus Aminicenantia bacterium]
MSEIIKVENLRKVYPTPTGELEVFSNLNFNIKEGELLCIMGVSGVGKTTLLNLLGTIDSPTSGRIFCESIEITSLPLDELIKVRRRYFGFVFQFHYLLQEFTALENVAIPLLIRGFKKREAFRLSQEMLKKVGLEKRFYHKPTMLSGGENQRVSVARAIVHKPKILLTDEPTGNLDPKTAWEVFSLIKEIHISENLTTIIVTHNEKIARECHRRFLMENGDLKEL